jgi:hypothetical protein
MTTQCKLDRCQERFTPKRPGHKFCCDAHRAEYRRDHQPGTGTIKALRQLKTTGWSVTIHFDTQPAVSVGAKIQLSRD